MIANYRDKEVHVKCVEYTDTTKMFDDFSDSPKGLTLHTGATYWEYTLSDGSKYVTSVSGPLIHMNKLFEGRNEHYTCSEIFISEEEFDAERKDGIKERIVSIGDVYIRSKKFTDKTVSETVWTPWRRLAFADEIPKVTCPFPIGFSFMLTTAYTDSTISDLKAAYPGTSWGHEQVAGLYNTNVIRRTK